MARIMINENGLPKYFWAEAINTACLIENHVYVAKNKSKTPYDLWIGRVPNIGYFKVLDVNVLFLIRRII